MSSKLVPWPRAAGAVAVVATLVFAAMAIDFHRKSTGTAFDTSVDNEIRSWSLQLMKDLVHVADPDLVVLLFLVVVIWALVRRRWDVALLAVLVPITDVLLVEHVFKPLIHRTQSDAYVVHAFGYEPLAFPSGHESGIGSLIAVCGLLVLGAGWSVRRKAWALSGLAAVGLVAAIALVGRYYHYATDTIGSMLLCTAVTIGWGLVIDRLSSLVARDRPRMAPAA
jgi:undecaprenyl-diphosphatase